MRVLVIGGLGSIGSRYVSILKYLGHEALIVDLDGDGRLWEPHGQGSAWLNGSYDNAIIATPTDTHYDWCKRLIERGKPFLCEKPLATDLDECKSLVEMDKDDLGRVVFNYAYLVSSPNAPYIRYDYYKTGKDGFHWDLCQIIRLDRFARLNNKSPIWSLYVNGRRVPYAELEETYIHMLEDWLSNKYHYSLQEGLNMTNDVLARMKEDGCAS